MAMKLTKLFTYGTAIGLFNKLVVSPLKNRISWPVSSVT